MGRAVPGHTVEIVDDDGNVLPSDTPGNVAVKSPDPVMFLNYWNKRTATEDKFAQQWLLTGDMARKDSDGYFWFVGRQDDLITSAGYRIGPCEIEDCLIKHPQVAMAAVIGVPDKVRTEIVKAFIILNRPAEDITALKKEIQEFVRIRLAAHEYPREIEFVEALSMTATGKIIRKALRERESKK
jgi:acetyl-CoA synthetase